MSMPCPKCGAKAGVKDSRYRFEDRHVYRRYRCEGGHKFTTYETLVPDAKPGRKAISPVVVLQKRMDAARQALRTLLGETEL